MTERAQRIATLYREGKGQREISRLLGISQPAVHKCLRKLGLLITPAPPRGDTPEESPAPLPDNQCHEPSLEGDNSPRWPWGHEVPTCQNCGRSIPEGRDLQQFLLHLLLCLARGQSPGAIRRTF